MRVFVITAMLLGFALARPDIGLDLQKYNYQKPANGLQLKQQAQTANVKTETQEKINVGLNTIVTGPSHIVDNSKGYAVRVPARKFEIPFNSEEYTTQAPFMNSQEDTQNEFRASGEIMVDSKENCTHPEQKLSMQGTNLQSNQNRFSASEENIAEFQKSYTNPPQGFTMQEDSFSVSQNGFRTSEDNMYTNPPRGFTIMQGTNSQEDQTDFTSQPEMYSQGLISSNVNTQNTRVISQEFASPNVNVQEIRFGSQLDNRANNLNIQNTRIISQELTAPYANIQENRFGSQVSDDSAKNVNVQKTRIISQVSEDNAKNTNVYEGPSRTLNLGTFSGAAPKRKVNQPLIKIGEPIIRKSFYIHSAPEEEEEVVEQKVQTVRPEKHYKIIFIKAPKHITPVASQVAPTPRPEEKTIVYVLVNKQEPADEVEVEEPVTQPPSKPEVYFIKYNTKEKVEEIVSQIKSEGFDQTKFNNDEIITNIEGSGYENVDFSQLPLSETVYVSQGISQLDAQRVSEEISQVSQGVSQVDSQRTTQGITQEVVSEGNSQEVTQGYTEFSSQSLRSGRQRVETEDNEYQVTESNGYSYGIQNTEPTESITTMFEEEQERFTVPQSDLSEKYLPVSS